MRVQRTRTKQLRAPLTTTLGTRVSEKYAVQFQLMFVVDWIIVLIIINSYVLP